MTFFSIDQQAEAIQLMMEASKLPAFRGIQFFAQEDGHWVRSEAFEFLLRRHGILSHGEELVLAAANDFWKFESHLALWDLIILDARRIELVLGLFQAFAVGPAAVDRWMAEQRRALAESQAATN